MILVPVTTPETTLVIFLNVPSFHLNKSFHKTCIFLYYLILLITSPHIRSMCQQISKTFIFIKNCERFKPSKMNFNPFSKAYMYEELLHKMKNKLLAS